MLSVTHLEIHTIWAMKMILIQCIFVDNNFSSIQSLLSDINEEDVELTRSDVEGSIVDGMPVVGNETDDENFN